MGLRNVLNLMMQPAAAPAVMAGAVFGCARRSASSAGFCIVLYDAYMILRYPADVFCKKPCRMESILYFLVRF